MAAYTLSNGEVLHLEGRGNRWEGRVVPRHGNAGWRLEGDAAGSRVLQLPKSDLVCHWTGPDGGEVAGLPPISDGRAGKSVRSMGSIPILDSLPEAEAVIYLDFDGETVSGTQWNSSFMEGEDIVAADSGFSTAEMESIWRGVAEDYAPFRINVTTDRVAYEAASRNRRTMVIFTPDHEWYGSSGGVAYVDVFGSSFSDPPAWVFTSQISYSASYAAEAASHEAGHTLGLHHDGDASGSYSSGTSAWGPIMGAAYTCAVTHWSRGDYPDADNFEDDLAIIAGSRNGFGYRADDHSNSSSGASGLEPSGPDGLTAGGVIERGSDTDLFVFQTSGGSASFTVDNAPGDPNLDVRLSVIDESGSEVAVADPAGSLDASLHVELAAGTYHVSVAGTGNDDPVLGYSDYGSLGAYTLSASVPRELTLAAEIVSPTAEEVSLPAGTGLMLNGVATGGSPAWTVEQSPDGSVVSFSAADASATDAVFSDPGIYVLRFSSNADEDSEWDEVTIAVDSGEATFTHRVPAVTLPEAMDVYSDRHLLQPQVSDDSPADSLSFTWQVISGPGQLESTSIPTPELLFTASSTPVRLRLEVGDGSQLGFAETVLTAHFRPATLVTSSAYTRVLVPDGEPDSSWNLPYYNDFSWDTGHLGAGFDLTGGRASRRIYLPEIGSGLDLGDSMAGSRSTCYLRIPFALFSLPASVSSLQLRLKYDDGFVAYINGVEVARANAGSGTPDWDAIAPSDRPDEEALSSATFDIDLPPGTLISGTNVLAIHGLNSSSSPSDRRFLIAAEMTAIFGDAPPEPVLTPFEKCVEAIADVSLRGPDDDPDGDGLSNLLEHAFGGAPEVADHLGEIVTALDTETTTVILPDPAPEDVVYFLEHCDSLAHDWKTVAERTGSGAWVGSVPADERAEPDGRRCYEFQSEPRTTGFFRLRVGLTP